LRRSPKLGFTDRSRLFYRFAYLLGFKPWDSGVTPPELVELIEGPAALQPGRALDLGCGTGTNCRYLSDRHWDVTGVDFSARAIKAARRRAPNAKVIIGDITRLSELGVVGTFDLLLDIGCFHSIPDARRNRYLREVARVAAPGATLLLFAFGEKETGTPAVTETDIRERFGQDFEVVEVRPGAPFRKQTWYRMTRRQTTDQDA
jgi:SAM-dependent methyltransferase